MKVDSGKWMSLVSSERRGLLPGMQRMTLAMASLPYSMFMRLRNVCYDCGLLKSERVDIPVVVVGNLTVGGTGKTPAVEYIARFYRQHDQQVAILSRGYGSAQGRNDEAMVLDINLNDVPHLQDPDRVKLAKIAIEELESNLLVLDDGFQHRRLARNLDVVLIDATSPWGHGWCLPRGLLREPRSGLRRAGAVLITRTDQVEPERLTKLCDEVRSIVSDRPIAITRHAPHSLQNAVEELNLELLQCQPVAAFCGIGNPASFMQTLKQLGCRIIDQKQFADHHQYQRDDVQALEAWARKLPADTWLLTTQKDWVKLRVDQLGGKPLWSLRIALEITQGRSALEAVLLNVIGGEGRERSDPVSVADSVSLPSSGKDAYDYATISPV